jgi:hypothetical protein
MTGPTRHATAIPACGDVVPPLAGRTPSGDTLRTRDFFMRRNLALVFVRDDSIGRAWVAEAVELRRAARAEAGEILVIGPTGVLTGELPSLVDDEGDLAARYGLAPDDLPALFVVDRFGTLFSSTHGERAIADLRPRDIPGWLEFIACRCS